MKNLFCFSLNWSHVLKTRVTFADCFMVAPFLPSESQPASSVVQWTVYSSFYLGTMQRASRLKRELNLLATEPPPGITCWQDKDKMDDLQARRYHVMRMTTLLKIMLKDPIEDYAEIWTFVYSKVENSGKVKLPYQRSKPNLFTCIRGLLDISSLAFYYTFCWFIAKIMIQCPRFRALALKQCLDQISPSQISVRPDRKHK